MKTCAESNLALKTGLRVEEGMQARETQVQGSH